MDFFLKKLREVRAARPERRRSARLGAVKGHRAVGGIRASIYNAMPIEGVKRLVEYMREFEAKRR